MLALRSLSRKLTSNKVSSSAAAARAYTSYSQLPEEHRMVHEMCARFADEELAPNAGEWDKKT